MVYAILAQSYKTWYTNEQVKYCVENITRGKNIQRCLWVMELRVTKNIFAFFMFAIINICDIPN